MDAFKPTIMMARVSDAAGTFRKSNRPWSVIMRLIRIGSLAAILVMILGLVHLTYTFAIASTDSPDRTSRIIDESWPYVSSATVEVSWSMAGANPQRTSWVPEGVDPTSSSQFGVVWFRPIEAYIGQHVQLIAARDKIYVATARGLYALDTATGDLVWRFDTQLPLGHSPTVDGEIVYVGGLDKHVYALNADTGSLIWNFAGSKAGFSTSPLVAGGKVLLGGRDGYFYALDQLDGSLLWQFPRRGQEPLGPILYSAAYQNGRLFFAANDNHAYALDASNGELLWKSAALPGDGYQAWWPVVYDEYVVFSSALPYADTADPGSVSIAHVIDKNDPYFAQMNEFNLGTELTRIIQRDDVFHSGEAEGSQLGPTFVSGGIDDTTGISWSWANGKTVVDASKATEYLEDDGQVLVNRHTNKSWRRGVIILNVADGAEFTFDSDSDSYPEFAPFLFVGTKSGNRYPPLVIPTQNAGGEINDVLYAQNFHQYAPQEKISKATLTGWQFGTEYILPLGTSFAIDEPFADSAGGTMLYQNLCCDRAADAQNLENGSSFRLFGYAGKILESIKLPWNEIQPWMRSHAPGYDEMWSESSIYEDQRRTGSFGTTNGIYHNHGLQNPIIPYKGRLFVHRSNAIIALGPNSEPLRKMRQDETPQAYEQNIKNEYPHIARPLLTIKAPDRDTRPTLSTADIRDDLNKQIGRMMQIGHLRPGYYNSMRWIRHLTNYFENPGETLYTLVQAYPHVSDSLKPSLEKYIKQHYRLYFENGLQGRTGYVLENPKAYNLDDPDGVGQLQPREWMPVPPEVTLDMATHQPNLYAGPGWPWEYPQHNFYAMWRYGRTFYEDDREKLAEIYGSAKGRLEVPAPDSQTLVENTWAHNGYISGYIGILRLQEMAGMSQQDSALRTTVQTELNRLLSLRSNDFRKDHPWDNSNSVLRKLNVARNFMYLTPELAEYLRNNALAKISEAVDEYDSVAPYWLSTRYEATYEEFASDNLFTQASMFQAKAYIMHEPVEHLLKYIDVPAFKTGDLFHIQNLVAILEREAQSVGVEFAHTPVILR